MPLLSIIIVNYNVREYLYKCLLSIKSQQFRDFEIIVVDNNSNDGSIEMVKEQFPDVQLILNTKNNGFPAANNQAIRTSKGEIVLLLNPDTELTGNVLEDLVNYIQKHTDFSIVAPCLLNSDGTVQYSIFRFIRVWEIIAETFYLHLGFIKSRSYYNQTITQPLIVEAVSGAAMLMNKKIFSEIGMLDEDLFWTEDLEFCYRAHKHGLKAIYLPDLKIIHHGGASGKKNQKVMVSNQVLTKIKFFQKNHSKLEFIVVWIFRFIHVLSRVIILFLLSIFIPMYRDKFLAYVYTFKRLITGNY